MSDFLVEGKGPDEIFGVFEDDGETGYLYIYSPHDGVSRHLHVYDRTHQLAVTADDVRVLWSADLSKCGVVIWGQMRGIIDLATNREGRAWMDSRSTPGIRDARWLSGFNW